MKHKIIVTAILAITLFIGTSLSESIPTSSPKVPTTQIQDTLMPCNDPVDTWDDEFF